MVYIVYVVYSKRCSWDIMGLWRVYSLCYQGDCGGIYRTFLDVCIVVWCMMVIGYNKDKTLDKPKVMQRQTALKPFYSFTALHTFLISTVCSLVLGIYICASSSITFNVIAGSVAESVTAMVQNYYRTYHCAAPLHWLYFYLANILYKNY